MYSYLSAFHCGTSKISCFSSVDVIFGICLDPPNSFLATALFTSVRMDARSKRLEKKWRDVTLKHMVLAARPRRWCVCPNKVVSQGRLVSSSPYCHWNCTFHRITTEFSAFGGNKSNLHVALLWSQPEEVAKMKQTYTFSTSSSGRHIF